MVFRFGGQKGFPLGLSDRRFAAAHFSAIYGELEDELL